MYHVNNYVTRARISALLKCWSSQLSCFRRVEHVAPDGYEVQESSFVEYPLQRPRISEASMKSLLAEGRKIPH